MKVPPVQPGARLLPDGRAVIALWAPKAREVRLRWQSGTETPSAYLMVPSACGYFGCVVEKAAAGDRYGFMLDGQEPILPDPRSRYQPDGVDGLSQLVDSESWPWRDGRWMGMEREAMVFYEMHIGCFTGEGTFTAAIPQLERLKTLGITMVELMPLAQCSGRWNWGYDGVGLFAINSRYGTPDDLRRFVETCHQLGMGVIVDVVYNHLGPEGNYLPAFGPYLSSSHRTPWGPGLNFDGEGCAEVRRYVIENALMWLEEYHLDGLRLDATRDMADRTSMHILKELNQVVKNQAARCGYPLYLFAENNLYSEIITKDVSTSGYGLDAQWSDDIGHCLLSALGQPEVYGGRFYKGFDDLAPALRQGYLFTQNENGLPGDKLRAAVVAPMDRLVVSLQNHDKVGNDPKGRRVASLADPVTQMAAAAIALLHPAHPLIFMGEEWGCRIPFYYFVDFNSEALRRAVEEGRAREFAARDWSEVVSPLSEDAFFFSKLEDSGRNDEVWSWYQCLLSIRRRWLQEGVLAQRNMRVEVEARRGLVSLRYHHKGTVWSVLSRFGRGQRGTVEITGVGKEWVASIGAEPGVLGASALLPAPGCLVAEGALSWSEG